MIEIKNVSKKYGNEKVLDSINLTLPNTGIVAIRGQSGCGKTTLLNCIAGLIDFEGTIKINNYNFEGKSDKENSEFRLSNFGFVFQDFRLFNNETVRENILFPLETLNCVEKEKKNIKCNELLNLVNLYGKEKQFVSTLSGGEKQRVCIARSLVNNPKIILADEPTGALDEANSLQIMDILSKISSSSLVIFVTHDDNLANLYGDIIVDISDGKITKITDNKHEINYLDVPLINNGYKNKKPTIPFWFILKHSIHALMKKKVRTFVCLLTTSIGLIGIGLALSISSFISSNVKEAYSSLIKKDQIVISARNSDRTKLGEYAGSILEATSLKDKHPNYIKDVGINYVADFENIFSDSNELDLYNMSIKTPIKGITARSINEYEWIDDNNLVYYPTKPEELDNDEIYLGLSINNVLDLCYALRIERSVNSFSNYLAENDCYVVFNFAHLDWGYEDEQILLLKGFVLDNEPKIFHTNHKWNEYMFETCMKFPTTDVFSEDTFYPWTMKKCPYLYCNDNIDDFLTFANVNKDFESYVLEIATKRHYPLLYKTTDVKDKRRVMFYNNSINSIPLSYIEHFEYHDDNIIDPLIGGSKGLVIYGSSLMMGFSENAYLSFDLDKIDDAIDIETNISLVNDQEIEFPEGIFQGYFAKSVLKGLSFSTLPNTLLEGNAPKNLDEIVISKAVSSTYKGKAVGETIYFSFPNATIQNSEGKLINEYQTVPLKVVGIVDSDENLIYHNSMWPVSFFQSRIGLSMFDLKTQSISFSVKDSARIEESLFKLNKAFPQFDIINPLQDVNESVDELSNYVSIVSLIFSLFASITSILLLNICSYLHVFETRNEISLARCIGVNKTEANKFAYGHSITLSFLSFIFSSVELTVLSFVISIEMTGKVAFSISIWPYLAMFSLALIISVTSAWFISLSMRRNNAIDIAKY